MSGVGLSVLWRSPAGYSLDLLMVGYPSADWHLELVGASVVPTPTEEDLLVLYFWDVSLTPRVEAAGGRVVVSRNPYWDDGGVTVVDPDGYRLVLTTRTWPAS